MTLFTLSVEICPSTCQEVCKIQHFALIQCEYEHYSCLQIVHFPSRNLVSACHAVATVHSHGTSSSIKHSLLQQLQTEFAMKYNLRGQNFNKSTVFKL